MERSCRPTPEEDKTVLDAFLRDGTARALRDLAGLTVDELAERIGVEPQVVRAWEEGRVFPEQPYAVRKYLAVLRELCVMPTPPSDEV